MQRYAAVAGLRPRLSCRSRADASLSSPLGGPGHARPRGDRPAAGRVAAPRGRRREHDIAGRSPIRRRAAPTLTAPSSWPCDASRDARGRHAAGRLRRGPGRLAIRCRPILTGRAGSTRRPRARRRRHARRAVAGHRGHRRRARLVLLPAGMGGAGLARPPGRWRGAAAGTPRRPPPEGRRLAGLLAGRRVDTRRPVAPSRRDASARAGLAGAARRARLDGKGATAPAAGTVPPAGPCRPRLLVVCVAVSRPRVRLHGPQHRDGPPNVRPTPPVPLVTGPVLPGSFGGHGSNSSVQVRRQGHQGRFRQGVGRSGQAGRRPRLRQLPDGRPLRQPAGAGPGDHGGGLGHQLDQGRTTRRRRRLPQPRGVRQGGRHHRPVVGGALHDGARRRLVEGRLRHRRHRPGRRQHPHRAPRRGHRRHARALGEGKFSYKGKHYTVAEVDGKPAPVSDIPILVGGGGQKILSLAAQKADIVGINPKIVARSINPKSMATAAADVVDQKLAWVKDAAGDRIDQKSSCRCRCS